MTKGEKYEKNILLLGNTGRFPALSRLTETPAYTVFTAQLPSVEKREVPPVGRPQPTLHSADLRVISRVLLVVGP